VSQWRIFLPDLFRPDCKSGTAEGLEEIFAPAQANSKHKFRLIFKFLTIKARNIFSILKIILIDFQYIKVFMA